MRPQGLASRIFLDGGDPDQSRELKKLLGFLDGQTTNPTLISRNPEAARRMEEGRSFSEEELLGFYKGVIEELEGLVSESVSIEVYADRDTTARQMLTQAREMSGWSDKAHIKFPASREGLTAAQQAVAESIRVNMTLCFTQAQAAAVHAATRGAGKGDVFVSPFIGRLDDQGLNGMDLIANVIRMYREAGSHAEVLTASVRTYDHLMYALSLGTDIVTAPYKLLREWGEKGMSLPGDDYVYNAGELEPIPYETFDLSADWTSFDIGHELTDTGMEKFSADWNALIQGKG